MRLGLADFNARVKIGFQGQLVAFKVGSRTHVPETNVDTTAAFCPTLSAPAASAPKPMLWNYLQIYTVCPWSLTGGSLTFQFWTLWTSLQVSPSPAGLFSIWFGDSSLSSWKGAQAVSNPLRACQVPSGGTKEMAA